LIKHLLKTSKEEKIASVRIEVLSCLRVLVEHTFNYSTLHANYELIFAAVVKGIEEPEEAIQ
jgi:hypothetical protein